ncbi:hypothetical protein ACROYT_G021745 [Oculina patagonica]
MATNESFAICGLPGFIGIARNDTVAYINDILLAVVNGPSAMFAFLSNLAIIVAVVKNPSLQKPSNILMCSLAFTDCLTGITAQPIFVAWRFFLQRAQRSCSHQRLMFDVYYTFNVLIVGLSFNNIVIISFDRHYALSRTLAYRANVTKKGTLRVVILASIVWLLYAIFARFILPVHFFEYIAYLIAAFWFIVIPIANHIRMLLAIRRHNSEIGDAVAAHQMSTLFRREKKVALNMWIVAIFLLASLTPILSMKIFEVHYPRVHAIAFPWSLTVPSMTSCINPVIYLRRNVELRNAVKSMMNI